MADQQVGNIHGVTAVGKDNITEEDSLLSAITANGINTVTVDDLSKIRVGMSIDLVTVADGTVVASNRTVDSLTGAGVLTYSGADAATTTAEGVYPTGEYGEDAQTGYTNVDSLTIAQLRRRLKTIDANAYSDENLDTMTYNDLVYAVRLNDDTGTI